MCTKCLTRSAALVLLGSALSVASGAPAKSATFGGVVYVETNNSTLVRMLSSRSAATSSGG
jgi:hypothetical protein